VGLADGRLATWSHDHTARLWAADGTQLAVLTGHTAAVRGLVELADGRFATRSDYGTARLWTADGTQLAVLTGHTGSVRGLVELADGRLATSSLNEVIVWSRPDDSPEAGEVTGTLLPLSSQASLVSATGVYLISASGPLLAFDLPDHVQALHEPPQGAAG